MPLLEAAQRIAQDFDYSDDDVIKGAKHFVHQMGMTPPPDVTQVPPAKKKKKLEVTIL